MEGLHELIATHEDWLMERILAYARARKYTKYTSTLAEAWRLSVQGLSQSLLRALEQDNKPLELDPDADYTRDPIAAFGIMEAQRHRQRGISLSMFLGLMKYYRQGYLDLVRQAGFTPEYTEECLRYLERFFDRVEIAFCTEWSHLPQNGQFAELQEANRTITNEKNKYLTIFESTADPVVFLDADGRIENMNHAALTLFGLGNTPGTVYYGAESSGELPWLKQEIAAFMAGDALEQVFEQKITTDTGEKYLLVKLKRMLDVSRKFSGVTVMLTDLTEHVKAEELITYLAYHDPLTGLPNRILFQDRFKNAMAQAKRNRRKLAILMLDLDRFKHINDTMGHHVGDIFLKMVAERIKTALRQSDTIARMGGDEFSVLLPEIKLDTDALDVAHKILGVFRKPFTHESRIMQSSTSIGIAVYPEDGDEEDILLKKADIAMYKAKELGRNNFKRYSTQFLARAETAE